MAPLDVCETFFKLLCKDGGKKLTQHKYSFSLDYETDSGPESF